MNCTFSAFCFSLQIHSQILCSWIRFSKSLQYSLHLWNPNVRTYSEQFNNKKICIFKEFSHFYLCLDNLDNIDKAVTSISILLVKIHPKRRNALPKTARLWNGWVRAEAFGSHTSVLSTLLYPLYLAAHSPPGHLSATYVSGIMLLMQVNSVLIKILKRWDFKGSFSSSILHSINTFVLTYFENHILGILNVCFH